MEENRSNVEELAEGSTAAEAVPVAPSMGAALQLAEIPRHRASAIDGRTVLLSAACTIVGVIAGLAAWGLILLIRIITNVSFYGHFSAHPSDARGSVLGVWIVFVPVAGAFVIGLIARFGSRGVAGHGIPETMEHVLRKDSRIPARMTFLKPLSAAVSIGTGGPFGPEGPIIATGGALGSLFGQLFPASASERKVLLAAGASAGIAAAFNCPIAAVLLAVELLLFEFRPRSIIPVIFASVAATLVRIEFEGGGAMFPLVGQAVALPGAAALGVYTLLGAFVGIGAVILTRSVFAAEEFFEHLPIHWMWSLLAGALVVGIIGYFDRSILGAGYFNLTWLLSGNVALKAAAMLCLLKFAAWTISLGSGTSGGTLAPVFTIGGSLAVVLAMGAVRIFPGARIDMRIVALMGMVAIFAGASRALLTSILFAFEVTREPAVILPVLCGCAAAYLVSALLMRESIMTGKMAKEGVRVPAEYGADALSQRLVRDAMTKTLVMLQLSQTVGDVREWFESGAKEAGHQGYPVVDERGEVAGVVTRRDVGDPRKPARTAVKDLIRRPPVLVYDDCSLAEAADHMLNHEIGRLPVTTRREPLRVIGILTRGDLLRAQRERPIQARS